MKKKLSKKEIKKHNYIQDLKKELTLVIMAANFIKQYIDEYPTHLMIESSRIARIAFSYKAYVKELLDVSDKMMKEVEHDQRNEKPGKFKSICKFDDKGFLAVSILSLVINLLEIHKNMTNKKVVLDKCLYKIDDTHLDKDEVRNGLIVAGKFYDKIDMFYENKKINK